MEWPLWLRRRTGVEHLGPPDRFFAWTTIALSLLVLVYVGAWNAAKYPVSLGYDAQPNATYAHILLDDHHIPREDQSGESNQPPAYYLLAGVASRVGLHWPFGWRELRGSPGFPEASYRGAQCFNVLLALLSALCVLWLARTVAPGRPWIWAASVGFFSFLPVVTRLAAMLHPENLNLLCAAAVTAAVTDMYVHKRFTKRLLAVVGVGIGLGLATRLSMVFVVAALLVGSAVAMRDPRLRAHVPWRRVTIVAAVIVLLPMPWIAYRGIVQHSGPLNQTGKVLRAALHPTRHELADRGTSHAQFFHFAPEVFTSPWKYNFKNQAASQTYADMWGDWFATFAWSPYSPGPSDAARPLLRDQSYIGMIPTLFAICGWLALCWVALRKRTELAPLALVPFFAVGGYLYRAYVTLSGDGDVLKAIYSVNSAPVWALGFAVATAWLARRSMLARIGMIALFAVFAVLELRFTLYGIRDHHVIF